MDIQYLRTKLDEIASVSREVFLADLEVRKQEEMNFLDRYRDWDKSEQYDQDTYERLYGNKKYYAGTRDSRSYVDNWLKDRSPGKIFLDYACGDGENAIKAVQAGADFAIGIDISEISIRNAQTAAAREGVSDKTYFLQADAENTRLPDKSVDVVLCSGVLHHLDLSYAFPEIRRIVKIGGHVLGVEALDYNPLIKLYRKLTPQMRTEWEKSHILNLGDLRFAGRFFEVRDVRFWHMLGILEPHLPWLRPVLQSTDRVLTRLPLVRLMAWIYTFELIRKD